MSPHAIHALLGNIKTQLVKLIAWNVALANIKTSLMHQHVKLARTHKQQQNIMDSEEKWF